MNNNISFIDSSTYFKEDLSVYQKIINANYIKHREIYSAIQSLLNSYNHIHNFLDLGCGDASRTAAILPTTVERYVGIDKSLQALIEAGNNIKLNSVHKELIQGDFAALNSQVMLEKFGSFDLILSCYSFHHLRSFQKEKVLAEIYKSLNVNGFFVLADLFLYEQENNKQFFDRYFSSYMPTWDLSPDEMQLVRQHMLEDDLLENNYTIKTMAKNAGFKQNKQLYRDELNFFEAWVFFK